MIAKDANETKNIINKTGKVNIGGWECPVWLCQIDDTQAGLFIDYKFSLE